MWVWWLTGLGVVLLAAGTYGGYRWRVAAMERRSRALALEVSERTLELAQQTADLEALYQADEELGRHVQLDEVLQALVSIAVDTFGADKSALLCREESFDRLTVRVARNFSGQAAGQLAAAEGIAGRVMATSEPIAVEDVTSDPLIAVEHPDVIAALLDEGVRSFFCLPVKSEAGVFGVLCVSYNHPRAFDERDQKLLTALARRAAIAVDGARHFAAEQRMAERFRLLNEVSRHLASILDVDRLLQEAAHSIDEAFGYSVNGIALVEGDGLILRASSPPSTQEPLRLRVGEGVMGWVAATGQPLLVPDVSREGRFVRWPAGASTRSELAVPLMSKGGTIGVLNVESEQLNAFAGSDVAVLQALANQIAIAVENAQLYEEARSRVAQLTALAETSRAVTSTLDIEDLLILIIQQATSLMRADGGLINLIDWAKQEDEVLAATGAALPLVGGRSSLDGSLSGWVSLHNCPVVSNDVPQDDRVAAAAREWVEKARIRSAAVAPLSIKEQAIGTLVVIGTLDGNRRFDQGDLDLLLAFANQAAVAIENARLYQRAQETAASEERSRLARDLHDAVTQTLFSASLIAEALPATWEGDQTLGRQLLSDLRQLTRGALAEMRTLLMELRPSALVEANLGDLLRQLAESVSGQTGIPVKVTLQGCPVPVLPDAVHVALYRIAQEALNNIAKHAQATHAEVSLCCTPVAAPSNGTSEREVVRVALSIADDGRGFDPAATPADHLGLKIIRERAQEISAALAIDSRPGHGTRVAVVWQ